MQLLKVLAFAAAFAGYTFAKPIDATTADEPAAPAVTSPPGTEARNNRYDRDYNRRYDRDYNRNYNNRYDRDYNRQYNREYDRHYDLAYNGFYNGYYDPGTTITTIIITTTTTTSDGQYGAEPTSWPVATVQAS